MVALLVAQAGADGEGEVGVAGRVRDGDGEGAPQQPLVVWLQLVGVGGAEGGEAVNVVARAWLEVRLGLGVGVEDRAIRARAKRARARARARASAGATAGSMSARAPLMKACMLGCMCRKRARLKATLRRSHSSATAAEGSASTTSLGGPH